MKLGKIPPMWLKSAVIKILLEFPDPDSDLDLNLILIVRFSCHCQHFLKISSNSVHFLKNYIAIKQEYSGGSQLQTLQFFVQGIK